MKIKFLASAAALILIANTACDSRLDNAKQQDDLKEYFSKHKVGSSPDCAVIKNDDDYLLTIHGYEDDCGTCEQLIRPYNENPNLSVMPGRYSCVPLNGTNQ